MVNCRATGGSSSIKDYQPLPERIVIVTPNQEQDLLIEWSLYSPQQKEVILVEFRRKFPGEHSQSDLLEFLKEKLEIEGYWEKVGLR